MATTWGGRWFGQQWCCDVNAVEWYSYQNQNQNTLSIPREICFSGWRLSISHHQHQHHEDKLTKRHYTRCLDCIPLRKSPRILCRNARERNSHSVIKISLLVYIHMKTIALRFIQEHLYQQTAGYSFIHLGSKGSCSDDYNDEDGDCQHHWQEGHLVTHTDVLQAALKWLNDTDRCVAIRLTFPSLSMFRYSDRGSVKATVESRITKWRSASMWSGPTANTEQHTM